MLTDTNFPFAPLLTPHVYTTVFKSHALQCLKDKKYPELLQLMKTGYDFSSLEADIKGKFGALFLQICLRAYESEDYYKLAFQLVKAGIDITDSCERSGQTAFHLCMLANQTQLFQAIYLEATKQGVADTLLNKTDSQKRLPLSHMKSYEAIMALSRDEKVTTYCPEQGLALLPRAIEFGCPEELLMTFIEGQTGDDLSRADNHGVSPLFLACSTSREAIACRLIEKGATDIVSLKGSSLHSAINNGLWNIVEMLLPQATPEIILSSNGTQYNALISAIRKQREDVALEFIDRLKNSYFNLHDVYQAAKANNCFSIIEKLLPRFSADDLFGPQEIGLTVLDMAARNNRVDLALKIMEKASSNSLTRAHFERLNDLMYYAKDAKFLTQFLSLCPNNILNNRDIKLEANLRKAHMGLTCFRVSCSFDKNEIAKELLARDVFTILTSAHTNDVLEVIQIATQKGWDDIVGTIIKLLPVQFFTKADYEGKTPLFLACQGGHEKVALLLLNKGATDTFSENHGSSLSQAIQNDLDAVAERLIKETDKAILTKSNDKVASALLVACRKKNVKIALQIIEKVGDKLMNCAKEFAVALQQSLDPVLEKLIDRPPPLCLNAAHEGKTMLFMACEQKRDDLCLRLMKRGVKDRSTFHGSALTKAMELSLEGLVDKLLSLPDGNVLSAVDSEGRSPLFVACDLGREDLALRLIAKGAKDVSTKKGSSAFSLAFEKKLTQVLPKLEESLSSKVTAATYGGKNLAQHLTLFLQNGRSDLALTLVQNVKLDGCEGLDKVLASILKTNLESDLAKCLLKSISKQTLLATFIQLCTDKEEALCQKLVAYANQAKLENVTQALLVTIKFDMVEVASRIIDSFSKECYDAYQTAEDSPLFQAVTQNQAQIVKKLLEKGIENRGIGADRILNAALEHVKDPRLIQQILDCTPADVIKDSSDFLVLACKYGYENIALKMLQMNARDAITDNGTALYWALSNGHYRVVEQLLPNTSPEIINHTSIDGFTALSMALKHAQFEIAKKLLQGGADKKMRAFSLALFYAMQQKADSSLLEQITTGLSQEHYTLAFEKACFEDEQIALQLLDKQNFNKPKNKVQAIIDAIHSKFATLTKKLLEGASLDLLNTQVSGATVLIASIVADNFELAQELLARGAKCTSMQQGSTPLHLACKAGAFPLVLKMIETKAIPDINCLDGQGKTALECLFEHEQSAEACTALLKAGARFSLLKLKDAKIATPALGSIVQYLKEKFSDFPVLCGNLEATPDSIQRVIDLLYVVNPEIIIAHQQKYKQPHPIKAALLLGDKELLKRFAPYTELGVFFNLLRSDFLEEDSDEFRSLIISLFKEDPLSRKKGIIVAKFPEAPKGVYLFHLSKHAKKYISSDSRKLGSISSLLNNIQANHQITATPRDPKKRKEFYAEVATGLKLVISQLEKENNPEKWKLFLEEVASAGSACAIRYEQVANEQFITHCLGMSTSKPEDKIYGALSRMRYTLLQACAESRGMQQDVHIVRDLLQELAEELGIACHGVNKTVNDHYSLLPQQEAAKKEKLAGYKKKFCEAYTIESICNNFLLFPDYQQDCATYLNENPPNYWTTPDIDKVLAVVASMKTDAKSEDEIKAAVRKMGYPYPAAWSLEKLIKQIRFDAWASGSTDSQGDDHSFLYVIKDLTSIDAGQSQSLRFVTILELLCQLGVAQSDLKT